MNANDANVAAARLDLVVVHSSFAIIAKFHTAPHTVPINVIAHSRIANIAEPSIASTNRM